MTAKELKPIRIIPPSADSPSELPGDQIRSLLNWFERAIDLVITEQVNDDNGPIIFPGKDDEEARQLACQFAKPEAQTNSGSKKNFAEVLYTNTLHQEPPPELSYTNLLNTDYLQHTRLIAEILAHHLIASHEHAQEPSASNGTLTYSRDLLTDNLHRACMALSSLASEGSADKLLNIIKRDDGDNALVSTAMELLSINNDKRSQNRLLGRVDKARGHETASADVSALLTNIQARFIDKIKKLNQESNHQILSGGDVTELAQGLDMPSPYTITYNRIKQELLGRLTVESTDSANIQNAFDAGCILSLILIHDKHNRSAEIYKDLEEASGDNIFAKGFLNYINVQKQS